MMGGRTIAIKPSGISTGTRRHDGPHHQRRRIVHGRIKRAPLRQRNETNCGAIRGRRIIRRPDGKEIAAMGNLRLGKAGNGFSACADETAKPASTRPSINHSGHADGYAFRLTRPASP